MTHPSIRQYKRKMDFLTEIPETKTMADVQFEEEVEE